MDITAQLQLLKNFPLFKGFSDFDLKSLVKVVTLLPYHEETVLYHQGDYGDSFFIIVKGNVTISKKTNSGKNVPVHTFEFNHIFGEMAYFNQTGRRSFTAKAHPQTVLFKIPHIFLTLLQQSNKLTNNLMQIMSSNQQQYFSKTADKVSPTVTNLNNNKTKKTADQVTNVNNVPSKAIFSKTMSATLNANKGFSLSESEELSHKNMLYNHKFVCPACHKKFTSPKVLSKYVTVDKTDSDFCNYYTGINPLFYEISVCPKCSYGFTGTKVDKLDSKSLAALKPVLATLPKKDYCLVRDLQLAIETFLTALMCQTAFKNKKSLIAWLNLRLAWLYRYQNNTKTEQRYLQVTLENYLAAFSEEKLATKNELQLIYMIGELYHRLGEAHLAVKWFSQLVTHPENKKFPVMVKKGREQWQTIRVQMKKDNIKSTSNTKTKNQ